MTLEENIALKPVAESKRINVLDIIRGIALIGIILMNIEWFNRPIANLGRFDTSLLGLDHSAGWLIRLFVEGKFYKLFALLFGMGFAIMIVRAKEAGRPFNAWFIRRMIVLLIIGTLHLAFLWNGDILHDYAISGLILLGIVNLLGKDRFKKYDNPNSLLKLGLIWLMVPFFLSVIAGIGAGVYFDDEKINKNWQDSLTVQQRVEELKQQDLDLILAKSFEEEPITDEDEEIVADEIDEDSLTDEEKLDKRTKESYKRYKEHKKDEATEIKALSQGSYLDAVKHQISNTGKFLMFSPVFGLFILLPIFILGYWLVISNTIRKHRKHKKLFKYMTRIGLGAGLVMSISGLLVLQHPASDHIIILQAAGGTSFMVGQYFMAAGYLGLIVRMVQSPRWNNKLSIFAPFGRMALTNYLMQSVIMVSIFFGYAGGIYGQVSRAEQIIVVLVIVVFQIIFSNFWLKRYKFGPMEWLWRSLTYKKMQAMKLD